MTNSACALLTEALSRLRDQEDDVFLCSVHAL